MNRKRENVKDAVLRSTETLYNAMPQYSSRHE